MSDSVLTDLLSDLVSIPSVSPSQTADPVFGGEERIAAFFSDYLERLGFEISLQYVEPGRPNVIARFGSENPDVIWLLESHLDTVGVEGMKHPPFTPEIRDGKLYARGAADCKGAMAAALYALSRTNLEEMKRRREAVYYVGAMGEETGNNGARAVLERLPERLTKTIVLEPTESAIVHTHKGISWFRVDFVGRSAHGSNPDVGVNAIYAAMRFVNELKAYVVETGNRFEHPSLGKPTMNLGVIHAGIAPNVVPPKCRVELDWRVVPPQNSSEVLVDLRKILEGMKAEGVCLDYAVELTQNNEPLVTSRDSELVQQMSAACQASGFAPEITGVGWCCDASVFCGRSDETIVFGPGSIKQAHASEEFIDLNELEAASNALMHLLHQGVSMSQGPNN
ncbi:MAG: M20 family metallopeptidase [Kiritimatiellae bacterium]|nr:M20 family metallopeptidase [Kiritimatiellia bacterium]